MPLCSEVENVQEMRFHHFIDHISLKYKQFLA